MSRHFFIGRGRKCDVMLGATGPQVYVMDVAGVRVSRE